MRLFCTDQVKPPEFLKIDEGHEVINEDDKILIMASGTQACIPHMIAIKRMSKVRFRKDMDFSLGQKEMERKMNDRRHSICIRRTVSSYSHLSNNCGGWNKREGEAKIAKSLNVEAGINMEVGKYL